MIQTLAIILTVLGVVTLGVAVWIIWLLRRFDDDDTDQRLRVPEDDDDT
jgi:heme/copper-type cytochrome/quinol oxidase subunit 2